MEGYWAGLTDGKLWRSLGWIILGIILMLFGVAIWVTGQKNPLSIAAAGRDMTEQSQSYGEGRPDVDAAMRRATRTSRPTRRVRQVPAARPDQPFRRPRAQGAQAPAATQVRGKINVGDSPVIPLAIIGTGMYLAWFGVHYWRSDVKYPTDPLKAVLQGKGLPSNAGTPTADEAAVLKAAQSRDHSQPGRHAGDR